MVKQEEHKCTAENRFDAIEDKLDKLDQKLDDKLDKINANLAEHMSRTAILETRQDAFEKTQEETKEAIKEFNSICSVFKVGSSIFSSLKKPIWYIILLVLIIIFRGDSVLLEILKTLFGLGG